MAIICKECEAKGLHPSLCMFKAITWRHLQTHHNGMTLDEYCEKYPDAPVRDNRPRWADSEPIQITEDSERELLGSLSPTQQKYVVARLQCRTKDAAARAAGICPTTPYNWLNRDVIESLIGYFMTKPRLQAYAILADALPDALQTITDLTKSPDDKVALAASQDIADRCGISRKPSAPVDTKVFELMSTEQLDQEIERMLLEQKTMEGKFKEVGENSDYS